MENTPLQTLFSSDIGLLTVFTISFVIAMAIFLFLFVRKQIRRDSANHPESSK